MEEEIDLRIYIDLLLSWWREIVLFTVLAVIVAGGVSMTQPSIYEATASVAIVKEVSSVDLGSQLGTLTEADIAGGKYLDPSARRNALADLVRNTSIAETVIPLLEDNWLDAENEETDPSVLVGKVDGSVGSGTDLIMVQVTDKDPEKAAHIATVWAQAYVDYVNQLYSNTSGTYAAISKQLAATEAEYRESQAALETFLAENRIDELSRLIDEKQSTIDTLQADKKMVLNSFFASDWSNAILPSYIDAELARQIIIFQQSRAEGGARFSSALEERLGELARNYSLKARYERLLRDALAMREHLDKGGDPASNTLALALLKAQVFASSTGLPGDLQIQLAAPEGQTVAAQQADLDALVTTLSTYIEDLDLSNRAESAALLDAANYGFTTVATDNPDDAQNATLSALQVEVQQLKAELESQQAQQRELTASRDLAWESYNTLARREAEVRVDQEVPNREVRFAAPASVPRSPIPSTSLKFVVAVAAASGLMVAVFMAFFLSYLEQPPLLQLVFKKRKS